jgi:hypothetical protein
VPLLHSSLTPKHFILLVLKYVCVSVCADVRRWYPYMSTIRASITLFKPYSVVSAHFLRSLLGSAHNPMHFWWFALKNLWSYFFLRWKLFYPSWASSVTSQKAAMKTGRFLDPSGPTAKQCLLPNTIPRPFFPWFYFVLILFHCYFYIIIVLGVYCDMYKSAYNLSKFSFIHPPPVLRIVSTGLFFPFSYMSA